MSTVIIINPIAGGARPSSGRARADIANAAVNPRGERPEVFVTERIGHARELASAAVARGARLVVAWGGDGTLNEVASALVFRNVPLGIVPAGSGNGLARELGISLDPARALADALAAAPRPIDVGEVDGHHFVNLAGIGFDAHVASRFVTAKRRGFLGYATIAAKALVTYAPKDYRISSGGAHDHVRAVLVTIANSAQFGNGAVIAPGARVDDGELDLVVIEERSRIATVLSTPRLFNGTVNRLPGCRMKRIREVTVEADHPMTFHVDGEPVHGGTILRARVHPGALLVAVKA